MKNLEAEYLFRILRLCPNLKSLELSGEIQEIETCQKSRIRATMNDRNLDTILIAVVAVVIQAPSVPNFTPRTSFRGVILIEQQESKKFASLSCMVPSSDYCERLDLTISPKNCSLVEVRQSLRNVRDCYLGMGMSEETFVRFLRLIPNITSLYVHHRIDLRLLVSESRSLKWNLVKLNLHQCTVYDEGIIELVNQISSTLRELILRRCERLTEAAFTAIGSCSELRILILNGAGLFRDHHLEEIQLNAPHLKRLRVQPDLRITTEGLSRSMKRRMFRDPNSLSSEDPAEVAWREAFRYFEEVPTHVDGIVEVESVCCRKEVLSQIASSERLRVWQLSKSSKRSRIYHEPAEFKNRLRFFQGVGFRALTVEQKGRSSSTGRLRFDFTEFNSWRFLFLECENLTDEGLASIALQYRGLQNLFLNRCNQITDVGVQSALSQSAYLRKLYLSSCSRLSDRVKLALRTQVDVQRM